MKHLFQIAAFAALVFASPVAAQMAKSKVAASNGVLIDVAIDEFAGRGEYSAPSIDFRSQRNANGIALVARVKRGAAIGATHIQGFVMYSGSWRFFRSAVFKGGDPVDYKRIGGDVGSCRYGCTLTENFHINITPAQILKYAENGVLAVQLRSDDGDTAIVNIPVSYFAAISEIAK